MNLKAERLAAGLSQSQLSKSSGVSLRVIQSIEQGQRHINKAEAENVYRLASVLNVDMAFLLDLDPIDEDLEKRKG